MLPRLQKFTITTTKPCKSMKSCSIFAVVSLCLVVSCINTVESASHLRHTPQTNRVNHYFMNEYCNLESRTIYSPRKPDAHSLQLNSKNSASSARILTRKQVPSGVYFGLSSARQVKKQLNCTINILAPISHGLLVTVNSVGLPKNLTRLSLSLNQDSPHEQQIHLEGGTTSANYLLTQPQSSKISIHLQSFEPIDWSQVSFDFLFSVYRKANSSGCPNKSWFDCGDNICIPSSLVCDNNRNCPNGNDETMLFYQCWSPLFWPIVILVALALTLSATVAAVVLFIRRRQVDSEHLLSPDVQASSAEANLMLANSISKLDLHQDPANHSSNAPNKSYFAGFENPVWLNSAYLKEQSPMCEPKPSNNNNNNN